MISESTGATEFMLPCFVFCSKIKVICKYLGKEFAYVYEWNDDRMACDTDRGDRCGDHQSGADQYLVCRRCTDSAGPCSVFVAGLAAGTRVPDSFVGIDDLYQTHSGEVF